MRRCLFMTIQLYLSHAIVERENKFANAAWQLQATIRCPLLGQRKSVTLLSGHPNGDTQLLNIGTVSFTHIMAARSKYLSLQIKITFPLECPVYAINRTMFLTYEWFRFDILETYAKTRL